MLYNPQIVIYIYSHSIVNTDLFVYVIWEKETKQNKTTNKHSLTHTHFTVYYTNWLGKKKKKVSSCAETIPMKQCVLLRLEVIRGICSLIGIVFGWYPTFILTLNPHIYKNWYRKQFGFQVSDYPCENTIRSPPLQNIRDFFFS